MFGQTFTSHDLVIVAVLIVLEGVLSVDNALVLGLLARRLPKKLQKSALTYGLVGAFVFRVLAIATAAALLKWHLAKLLGGAYLVYISLKYFLFECRAKSKVKHAVAPDGSPLAADPNEPVAAPAGNSSRYARFWPTVVVIELTDIAFAIDSILAAIAMISSVPQPAGQRFHPKLWVVIVGGMLGVILMRFAAVVFIKLLDKFPRFEVSAYLLVIVVGAKLIVDWTFNKDPSNPRVNFHHATDPAFWVFWVLMVVCFGIGFIPQRRVAFA